MPFSSSYICHLLKRRGNRSILVLYFSLPDRIFILCIAYRQFTCGCNFDAKNCSQFLFEILIEANFKRIVQSMIS